MGILQLLATSVFISGVNPNLHTYNNEGECGTGSVVPWAGSLWAISYAPHMPNGSTDRLYEIKPDFTKVVRKESIGGTPANRLIHRESNQLFIGPYAIDAKGNVRVMRPKHRNGRNNLYGRLTASARHLTDPANKIYTVTMEEGVYEIDVHTLNVTELFRDGNIQGYGKHDGSLLPGYHGKGAYTGQGRLVYANNGEYSKAAMKDPTTTSGVLAEWNGTRGKSNWNVVLRNQFTDVTSKGGIYGAENPKTDPLWAIGWDYKSLILMVLDGGKWHRYRLPKGSHSYDGAHGWNTEWPRIREIGEGDDYLMTMHGMFWRFPATMSAKNAFGIRPRSNYLKIVGDFCRWGGKVVLGCDDTAKNEFLNKRKAKGRLGPPGQSNSSLWFLDPADFDTFGPVIGRGSVWEGEDVEAGAVSDPYLFAGFDRRMLFARMDGAGAFEMEVDEKGDGRWRCAAPFAVRADGKGLMAPLDAIKGEWVRFRAKTALKNATLALGYRNVDRRRTVASGKTPGGIFTGFVSENDDATKISRGIVRSGRGDERLPFEMVEDDRLYVMRPDAAGKLVLTRSDELSRRDWIKRNFKIEEGAALGHTHDAASEIITDDAGRRWRFPRTADTYREGRLCRECCTERDLLNIGGTFYELPAENAGGFAKARAIATHASRVHDYCTWRGLFIVSGVDPTAAEGEHFVRSQDGRTALWVGVADDLWKIGKPFGKGGPWLGTAVKAGEPSDPYIVTGFDRKTATVSADRDVTITLEFDVTGTGTWIPHAPFAVKAGETLSRDIGAVSAYWVRAVADKDCRAAVQFVYE